MLVLILFTGLNAFTIGTLSEKEEGLDLSFPLSSGTYAVLQGGGNVITNPFHTLSGSRYALDLTKLNALGNRARGIAPRDLYAYEILADTLQSPCSGSVLRVRDSLSDNTPGEIDTEHPEGNYVFLECANVEVLMARLKQGSVLVTPGASVATGQLVGEIGNSDNTMEPHLHIEEKKGAAAIPLTFDGRSLSINSLVRGLSWLSDSTGYRTGAPIVNSP